MSYHEGSAIACTAAGLILAAGLASAQGIDPDAEWAGYKNNQGLQGSRVVADGPAQYLAWTNTDLPTPSEGGFAVDADGFVYYVTDQNTDEAVDSEGAPIPGGEQYIIKIDPETGEEVARTVNLRGGTGAYSGVRVGRDALYYTRRDTGTEEYPAAILKISKTDLSIMNEFPVPDVDENGAAADDAAPSPRGEPLIGTVPNEDGNVNLYIFDRGQNLVISMDSMTGEATGASAPYPGIQATSFGRIGPLFELEDGAGGVDQAVFYAGNYPAGSPVEFPASTYRDSGEVGSFDPRSPGSNNALSVEYDSDVRSFNWFGSGTMSTDGETIYLATFNDNGAASMWAIDRTTGDLNWSVPGNKFQIGERNYFARPSTFNNVLYAAGGGSIEDPENPGSPLGGGIVVAYQDDGESYTERWTYFDAGPHEYTSIAIGGVENPEAPDGYDTYIYAMRQGIDDNGVPADGVYTNDGNFPAQLVVLKDLGDDYEVILEETLEGTMIPTLYGSASPTLDAEGNLYVAGGTWTSPLPAGETTRPAALYKFSVTPPCEADITEDGEVTISDLIAYIRAFRTGDADFDKDGATDIGDLIAYIRAFRAGC